MDTTSGILPEDSWQILIHICQRWRCVVFELLVFFDLQLLCIPKRLVQMMLDVWPPALPIAIRSCKPLHKRQKREYNIIEAFKQHNRVCKIDIMGTPNSLMEAFLTMKEPFPNLTRLGLEWFDYIEMPVLPDSFLGGSAPRLRSLILCQIPFPVVWKLLLSTSRLVRLHLQDILPSGYFSPEEMISGLSSLTSLEVLCIVFQPSPPQANRTTQSPLPRPTSCCLRSFFISLH